MKRDTVEVKLIQGTVWINQPTINFSFFSSGNQSPFETKYALIQFCYTRIQTLVARKDT